MKIKDFMIDSLNETKFFEMAFERKTAIQKARSLQNQISRHLIKVYMYSNSEYVTHWCNEINIWIFDIQDNLLKTQKSRWITILLLKYYLKNLWKP